MEEVFTFRSRASLQHVSVGRLDLVNTGLGGRVGVQRS